MHIAYGCNLHLMVQWYITYFWFVDNEIPTKFCSTTDLCTRGELCYLIGCCRKQFPALPTMTPVIPAWQLQGNSAEKSIEENTASRAETKSLTAMLENSENLPDTKLLVATETNQQSTDSVKDKLDHTQSEIIQVKQLCLLGCFTTECWENCFQSTN